MNTKVLRWIGFGLAIALIVTVLGYAARYSTAVSKPVEIKGYEKWDPELVEEFAALPVQDGGRIKPFSTWAGFEMLTINGKRSIKLQSGDEIIKLGPVEWALDCMFRPDTADQMPFFQVENAQVLDMIEMEHDEKKRRDRYSFMELSGENGQRLSKIDEIGNQLREKQGKQIDLDQIETQFVDLSTNMRSYISMRSLLNPVRKRLSPDDTDFSLLSYWVKSWPDLARVLQMQMQSQETADQARGLLNNIGMRMEGSIYSQVTMMPPLESDQKAWPARRTWLMDYMSFKTPFDQAQYDYLVELEKLALAYDKGGQKALLEAVKAYKKKIAPALESRGEGQSIPSEITYYKMDYFFNAFVFSILGFLAVALGWVAPGSKLSKCCNIIGWVILALVIAITVAGITHRSILMERPPVGNLYDTIPFIVAVSLIVLAIIEWLTKRSVCLGLALFLGIIGLTLAFAYEQSEGKDHMDPLIAVLRSNYWLTIHVLTITIGYAGGLLTAGLSYVYLLCRWLGLDEGDKKFRRLMTRVVYGGICFTLFFSLVGTILGGVWANDSWGRFWGWDPKENGALIIVLWCLIILHARLGGYIREWGLHTCSVIGAALVTFSWWHVNFLGTGLHSYGFTGDAGLRAVYTVYFINGALAIGAFISGIMESEKKKQIAYQAEMSKVTEKETKSDD
ncbi:cytochrome c biogenesis protein CcsA [Rubritalea halochordaticola]|uniref:Cytochrome c biogenesis protein CcsA n=1 Tax=Rubritalea halochordaticola TaxID=714537 RepID=A0ABP9UUG5_9BACT